jgi:hypothetical protein
MIGQHPPLRDSAATALGCWYRSLRRIELIVTLGLPPLHVVDVLSSVQQQ